MLEGTVYSSFCGIVAVGMMVTSTSLLPEMSMDIADSSLAGILAVGMLVSLLL